MNWIIPVTAWGEHKWINFLHVKGFQPWGSRNTELIFVDGSPPLTIDQTPEQLMRLLQCPANQSEPLALTPPPPKPAPLAIQYSPHTRFLDYRPLHN